MTYLIDTNIFIFLLEDNFKRLSIKQIDILSNPDNDLYLSEASFYEMGIKVRMNQFGTKRVSNEDFVNVNILTVEEDRKRLNIKLLKSKPTYYMNIPNVSMVLKKNGDRHGDPFDLLIISQAMVENLPILSSDEYFPSYPGLTTIT